MALIGDKTFGQWEQSYKDAYSTGGVEAENAMRQQYQNAANAMTPQSNSYNILSGLNFGGGGDLGNVSTMPSQVQQPSGSLGQLSGGGYQMSQQSPTPMPKPQGQDSMGFGAVGSQPGSPTSGSLGNVQAMGGGFQQNPYLPQMFDAVTNQVTTNFNRNVMPRVQSQMAAGGGYGGSRQGVIEANAMRDMNETLANSLAGLAGNAYGQGLNYDLGLRGNDLGYANLDANIAQNNFNNQLTGANFGLGLYDRLQMGNQAGIGAGTNIQNTPLNYWNQFGNQYNAIGQGFASQSTSGGGGNPIAGALGGWQLGSQFAKPAATQVGSWNDATYGSAF